MLGNLFTEREKAIKYLKEYIIKNPSIFINTRYFYINVMGKNETDIFAVNIDDPSDGQKNLDKFVKKVFDKYFATFGLDLYFDEIDGWFNNSIDAVKSMQEKITNDQFIIKYKFRDIKGIEW
ncbi:hypothetical protein [Spiroplasma endosymbiont of Ammophila pubescens]|uniref:hypothetical protein n=1 Tax=Spiroplasma endosymbiont of Ammophila pubescens TaxID=3066315 RepID=UPI0032B140FF